MDIFGAFEWYASYSPFSKRTLELVVNLDALDRISHLIDRAEGRARAGWAKSQSSEMLNGRTCFRFHERTLLHYKSTQAALGIKYSLQSSFPCHRNFVGKKAMIVGAIQSHIQTWYLEVVAIRQATAGLADVGLPFYRLQIPQ